jgi:hypothetical protein
MYLTTSSLNTGGQLDDNNLSRSLRAHGPTFSVGITFLEFKRDYINYLRAINLAIPDLLERATPFDAAVNIAYRAFQKHVWIFLRSYEAHDC